MSRGESLYPIPGTYTWVCPAGVTSVSVVCVGGGGGALSFDSGGAAYSGGGGSLGYANNISVTPGTSYSIVVGAGGFYNNGTQVNGGQSSAFGRIAPGGKTSSSDAGVAPSGDVGTSRGGGAGGAGKAVSSSAVGGGGAGGYSGAGGEGQREDITPGAGSGGGGGGGFGYAGGSGGGVGLLGQGTNGAAGTGGTGGRAGGGGGGSGGESGFGNYGASFQTQEARGGVFGGGAGMRQASTNSWLAGAGGAVRIIWPGTTRTFPSTDVGTP